jgi:hypothetical protein
MKKLILFCIIFFGMQIHLQAQNAPLNKQQTLDYIENLFKVAYYYKDFKVNDILLDGKILTISFSEGSNVRKDLSKSEPLKVGFASNNVGYCVHNSSSVNDQILWGIQTETDAKKLKKALEHLIEILKTEKSTDPFGE